MKKRYIFESNIDRDKFCGLVRALNRYGSLANNAFERILATTALHLRHARSLETHAHAHAAISCKSTDSCYNHVVLESGRSFTSSQHTFE